MLLRQFCARPIPTFAGNAQHTGIYETPALHLNSVRWSTVIDPFATGANTHYGAPVITPANTVITGVKTSKTNFQLSAFEGATGRLKYTRSTDYQLPSLPGWPMYQPLIAPSPSGSRLYFAGAGGTVYYVEDLDSDTPTSPVQECFYTDLATYRSNSNNFNATVFIDTPLTCDTNGVIFFGFVVQGSPPSPLNANQGGFARIDSAGNAIFVTASLAARILTSTRWPVIARQPSATMVRHYTSSLETPTFMLICWVSTLLPLPPNIASL